MKGGVFLGPARVLLQEPETTAEGFRVKGVVWITEGTSLVRCAAQHLRSLSARKDCAASQTQKPSVSKTLLDVCHTARFLISRHRQVLLTMLGKKKSLVGTHEAHEIRAEVVLSGHNDLMQHHVKDLTWCHQVDLRELIMKCQCKNTKRHMLLSQILRQVNRFHLTFLQLRLNQKIQYRQCPRVASRSNVLRIHWTVRNLRSVPEVTMMRIMHFSLLVITIWRRCLKLRKMAKMCVQ